MPPAHVSEDAVRPVWSPPIWTERCCARTAACRTGPGGPCGGLADQGIAFVIVTARPPRWLHELADLVGPHGAAVCANGAFVYDVAARTVREVHGIPDGLVTDLVGELRGRSGGAVRGRAGQRGDGGAGISGSGPRPRGRGGPGGPDAGPRRRAGGKTARGGAALGRGRLPRAGRVGRGQSGAPWPTRELTGWPKSPAPV